MRYRSGIDLLLGLYRTLKNSKTSYHPVHKKFFSRSTDKEAPDDTVDYSQEIYEDKTKFESTEFTNEESPYQQESNDNWQIQDRQQFQRTAPQQPEPPVEMQDEFIEPESLEPAISDYDPNIDVLFINRSISELKNNWHQGIEAEPDFTESEDIDTEPDILAQSNDLPENLSLEEIISEDEMQCEFPDEPIEDEIKPDEFLKDHFLKDPFMY